MSDSTNELRRRRSPPTRDLRTYFAPEVEAALVSLCWHEPARLAEVLRRLDPSTHFVQPHLRHILKAIEVSYRELRAVDWCTVVQVLREQHLLEECGDLQLLDQLWSNPGYQSLFDYYIELLRDYAAQRGINAHEPVYRFTGGKIQLEPNKCWQRIGDPDYVGVGRIAGCSYRVRGWKRGSDGKIEVKLFPRK